MQAYTLYTDRNENFECDVSVKNASLKGSAARIIIESNDGVNYVFEGKINGQKCNIPIRRMKGLLEENERGKMYLELIVEDTVFRPWQSEYKVESHTEVNVVVNENVTPNKPIVNVKIPTSSVISNKQTKKLDLFIPLKEITTICEAFDITKKTASRKKKEILQILKEYFTLNPEFVKYKKDIIGNMMSVLK